jgi:hypothetical protein
MKRTVALLFNLLQDVNVLRPLAYLAADDLSLAPLLLVTAGFRRRDSAGVWHAELQRMQSETGAQLHEVTSAWGLWQALEDSRGVLISGSESDLPNHEETYALLSAAPDRFTTVTLQHGFECVGFLMNRNHRASHGDAVGFAADVICGWSAASHLRDLQPAGRSRLVITGPSLVIRRTSKRMLRPSSQAASHAEGLGIVCENLHSLRFGKTDDRRNGFLLEFEEFASMLAGQGRRVALRPHPGGQYVLNKQIPLPGNVDLISTPSYELDWSVFAYGVSAPSSVIIDMVLAGIPVAVWQDENAAVDARCYDGLTVISSPAQWLAFERDVRLRPMMILQTQSRYLARTGLKVDADEVRCRFSNLLAKATA